MYQYDVDGIGDLQKIYPLDTKSFLIVTEYLVSFQIFKYCMFQDHYTEG